MPYKSDEGQPCRELVAYQSLLPDFYASFSPRYPCDARTPSLLCQRQAAAAACSRWEKMVPAQTRKLRRLEEGPKLGPHRKAAEVNRDEVNREDHRDNGGWAQ